MLQLLHPNPLAKCRCTLPCCCWQHIVRRCPCSGLESHCCIAQEVVPAGGSLQLMADWFGCRSPVPYLKCGLTPQHNLGSRTRPMTDVTQHHSLAQSAFLALQKTTQSMLPIPCLRNLSRHTRICTSYFFCLFLPFLARQAGSLLKLYVSKGNQVQFFSQMLVMGQLLMGFLFVLLELVRLLVFLFLKIRP